MEPFIPNDHALDAQSQSSQGPKPAGSLPLAESLLVLEMQVREIFGRTVYSHKTHEKCAEQFLATHGLLNTIQIILAAVTTGSLLLAVFGDNRPNTIIGAVLSTILFGLTAYIKDKDLGKVAQNHTDTAHQLWSVREGYFSLLTDIACGVVDVPTLMDRRDQLLQRLETIYAGAPRTTSRAYAKAQTALQQNEEMTFSATEIDAFLPKPLHRAKSDKTNPSAPPH